MGILMIFLRGVKGEMVIMNNSKSSVELFITIYSTTLLGLYSNDSNQ